MNYSEMKKELQQLSELIYRQNQLMLQHEGPVPKIELDILLHHYRRAYEILTELRSAAPEPIVPLPEIDKFPDADHIASVQTPPVITSEKELEDVVMPVEINNSVSATEEHPPVQPEVIIAAVETPVVSEESEIISEAVIPQAGLQKERSREFTKSTKPVAASLFDETPTIAQQFSSSATVRDRYTASADESSIAEKIQQDPLSDLKKSIGINEKFSFVNELFDGDLGSYNAAIELLNNCTDLNSAIDILSGKLAPQYQWSDEGSSFRHLKNLVTRRFSA